MRYKINPNIPDRDRPWIANAAQQSIEALKNELMRLIKLPYRDWNNQQKIQSLDKQIEYLEEVLAAFERDFKKNG